MIEAAKQNQKALQYAAEELCMDREIMLEAAKQNVLPDRTTLCADNALEPVQQVCRLANDEISPAKRMRLSDAEA